MKKYRFGLDVGTNSLGWSVLELNNKDAPCRIESAGVRIFSDGRNLKDKTTLKASRRVARSARRRRDRFLQRQKSLINRLKKAELFPMEEGAMKKLQGLNPLKLRAEALEKELHPHHIGRALFHLNQRRGFKSNRKDRSEETTSGKVSKSIRLLLEGMNLISSQLSKEEYKKLSGEGKKKARQKEAQDRRDALTKLFDNKKRTYGAFLWKRQQKRKGTRARPGVGEDGKLYDIYPQRELYEDEFKKIWETQKAYHSNLMTDEAQKEIFDAIFRQRPLKAQEVGKCSYLSKENRAYKAMPSFQRYRIYQEVNNLEWGTWKGKKRLIDYPKARDRIVKLLEIVESKNGLLVWSKMKKALKEIKVIDEDVNDVNFNFETPKRKGFEGNLTTKVMQHEDCVGQQWNEWSLEKQDEFIGIILDDKKDDNTVKEKLKKKFKLPDFSANKCIEVSLPSGTANVSLKAARLIMDKMKNQMLIQTRAVFEVEKENSDFKSHLTRDGELLDRLPYYGEAFQDGRHIIPGSMKEEDRHDDLKYFGGVTNPTVHIALNQIRHVVNELILRYGHPHSIAIELGRDLPAGEEQRREIEKEQKKNQDENKKIDEELKKEGHSVNRENRLKYKLWKELDKNPCGRQCPFSGKPISICDLFNGNIEIEHLLPFSKSLDDSRANKILCTRKANKDKGNRTPFEAFGDSPNDYSWNEIFKRVKNLPQAKQWRFQEDAWEMWYRESDFLGRHLNDTRYIGRLTKEYLEYICPFNKIDVLTGRLTALLRKYWGLNSVLSDKNDTVKKKNRDDHRHHAVDAIVIGMTDRSILQKVSTAAAKAENLSVEYLFEKDKKSGRSTIDPWKNFRDDAVGVVQKIIVSHKPNLKKVTKESTDGKLHRETAYGIISGPDKQGLYETVVRWPVEKFVEKDKPHKKRIEAIRDEYLKREFLKAFDTGGREAFLALAKKKNIRSIRFTKNRTVFLVKLKEKDKFKAYESDSNWAVEIYEHSGKWKGIVIPRYKANEKAFKEGKRCKPHPSARMVMRLKIDDCIEILNDNVKCLMRVQKINQDGRMYLIPITEANVDFRVRKKELKYLNKTANALRKLRPKKIHVSPSGRINYEKRSKIN